MTSSGPPAIEGDYAPEDDYDETVLERFAGLSEMFPDSIRNGLQKTFHYTGSCAKKLYGWSRTYVWIFCSSFTLAVAPALLQTEMHQMEEMTKMQQRQMLLGPNAAIAR